jgi:hemoglobin
MATLFEKLGGAAAVDVAVDRFFERLLQDDRIKHFFADTDMVQQRNHQQA